MKDSAVYSYRVEDEYGSAILIRRAFVLCRPGKGWRADVVRRATTFADCANVPFGRSGHTVTRLRGAEAFGTLIEYRPCCAQVVPQQTADGREMWRVYQSDGTTYLRETHCEYCNATVSDWRAEQSARENARAAQAEDAWEAAADQDEDEDEDDTCYCAACGSDNTYQLGTLGSFVYYRCRDCGADTNAGLRS